MSQTQTQTITLNTAITIGTTEHTELVIRKPLGGDLRGLKLYDVMMTDVDSLAKLLPRVTTNIILPANAVYDMDLDDLTAIATGLTSFLKSVA